jgi:ATP phosphoribosyltransferase regulatory subunit HisZ
MEKIVMKTGINASPNQAFRLAEELQHKLHESFGDHIQATLFGSQARGEATDEEESSKQQLISFRLQQARETLKDAHPLLDQEQAEEVLLSSDQFVEAVEKYLTGG